MYTITIIPSKENNTFEIPKEFFGKEIKIMIEEKQDIFKIDEKSTKKIQKKYDKYKKIDLGQFKFDRDEANNFD